MQTYEILVKNRSVVGNSRDMTLVRTSVGIDQVHVLFDNAEWLDFPITITFAQGEEIYTETLVVSEVTGSDWVAEATCDIPWQVIDTNGPIRITLQGTDSDGRHIITAKGAPLSVKEAGDVLIGEIPEDAPTIDQWTQAYADAMAAVNAAASLVSTLQGKLEQMVSEAMDTIVPYELPIASPLALGGVKVGDNLTIDDDGVLSATAHGSGMTEQQQLQLVNLVRLASFAFDTEFDTNNLLKDSVLVKEASLPKAKISNVGAVKVDDETIAVATDGTISTITKIATSDEFGSVKLDGSTVVGYDGVISVPTATAANLGIVRPDGTTITIDNGVLTANGGGGDGYILPRATDSQLGGVMVDGTTIGVVDGVISVILSDASSEEY